MEEEGKERKLGCHTSGEGWRVKNNLALKLCMESTYIQGNGHGISNENYGELRMAIIHKLTPPSNKIDMRMQNI